MEVLRGAGVVDEIGVIARLLVDPHLRTQHRSRAVANGPCRDLAGSSRIAASAARRFTASMPLRHDSFDSYVSLVARTPQFVAERYRMLGGSL